MRMKRLKINKFGVTLAEVAVAVLIFAVAAIPLYYAISYGAKEEVQLDKIAQANKILSSFKEECIELDYDEVVKLKQGLDGFNAPKTFNDLMLAQKQYKDFRLTVSATEKTVVDIVSLTVEAEVKWTRDGGGESSQKLSFVKVKR